jgi:hypothetical protein
MAIKKPTINKPGIVKPSISKKAPVAPAKVIKEEPVIEQVIEEVVEEVVEENEIEVPTDIVVQEESTSVEEVVEEPVQEVEQQQEEIIEEIPEDVVAEPESIVEEKPKKKSSSRKKSAKKSEEKVEEKEPVSIENYKAKPLVDAMKEMIGITGCTTPEWEATKAEITEQVQGMQIDPDSTPAEMRYLIADIDGALSQLKILKINADQQFNPLLKHINYVSLQAGSKGSNSEERKANAIRGLIEYKSNPDDMEYTNLLDIQVFAENQIAFYDEMIKILQDKKNMLITFSGIVKTETQLGGY